MNQQIARFDTNTLNRALVGFDSLFDNFEKRFANQIQNNYPPHNVVKFDDDTYELQIAVTGFVPEEVVVEVDQNQLIIKAESKRVEDAGIQYLHRGLASRDFTRAFALAEHMEVGEGAIKNGVLRIGIKRVVPDALKPRQLKIKAE
jgi:molecular chaperone IbpA